MNTKQLKKFVEKKANLALRGKLRMKKISLGKRGIIKIGRHEPW